MKLVMTRTECQKRPSGMPPMQVMICKGRQITPPDMRTGAFRVPSRSGRNTGPIPVVCSLSNPGQ